MGIFYDMCEVVNRAPIAITVRFDGQDLVLQPGVARIPRVAVSYGKNQNPIMGSQDPTNPHISGAQYLLGVVGEDPCDPLTQEEWEAHLKRPCRIDEIALFEELYGGDPKARMVLQGKPGPAAHSRYEATAGAQQSNDTSEFSGRV
jgi:hypothetical protein